MVKSTVLGFDFSLEGNIPHFRLGLVRYFYFKVPTSTNQLFAAPYHSYINAKLGITSQDAIEVFSTGASTNAP